MKTTNEDRTLSQFVKAKLSISARAFAEEIGMPVSTLYFRWSSDKFHDDVLNDIQEYYFNRYDDL